MVSGRLSARALSRYRWAGPLFPAALASGGRLRHADRRRRRAHRRARRIARARARHRHPQGERPADAVAAAARRSHRAPCAGRRQHPAGRGGVRPPGLCDAAGWSIPTRCCCSRRAARSVSTRSPHLGAATGCGQGAARGSPARCRPACRCWCSIRSASWCAFFPPPGRCSSAARSRRSAATTCSSRPRTARPSPSDRTPRTSPRRPRRSARPAAAPSCDTPGELADYWERLLADRAPADAAGARARSVAAMGADALEQTWTMLAPLLGADA